MKFNTVAVPPLYEESFKKAIMTFLHQLVYDPVTEDLVHLSELPAGADEDIEFLGPYPCNVMHLAILLTEYLKIINFLFVVNLFAVYLNQQYNATSRSS